MRPKFLQLIPTFLRNFNIEQRVYSKLDEIDHSNRPAPWHQSTAHSFELIKGFLFSKLANIWFKKFFRSYT